MSACRDSSVLEQIIYDYLRANQTDIEKNTFDDKENNEKDDKLNDLIRDMESQREYDKTKEDPIFQPEKEPESDEAAGGDANYSQDSDQSSTAQVTTVKADGGIISGGQSDDGESTGEDSKPNRSNASGSSNSAGESGTTGGTTLRLVVDDYGNQYEVPENVDSVAAVDSAAVSVLMLGGADRLAAADEELTSDALATAVFSGLSDVPALWSGDGTTEPLSDSELQRLIDIHPDVCLETSGSAAFSNAQVEKLRENGIYYVALPAPAGITDLKVIAKTVGRILGDHTSDGGYNSIQIAEEYQTWVDKTAAAVTAAKGNPTYTLYVDAWDESARYTITQAPEYSGYGAAVINNGYTDSCAAVSGFLKEASVTNVTSLGTFYKAETFYFTPIDGNYSPLSVAGEAASRLTEIKLLSLGDYLGSDKFRTVIAGDKKVKEGIESNMLWNTYDYILDNRAMRYGFLSASGAFTRTTIQGDYAVLANPRGIGDWAKGSVESILETVWAAYAITGVCSETEVKDRIAEFYSAFYRYTLSDEQLDDILAGAS